MKLTHTDDEGALRMEDVSDKEIIHREARANGRIVLSNKTIETIKNSEIEKGNVLECARLAGINAAKKTFEMIPLCHGIPLSSVFLDFDFGEGELTAESLVIAQWKTGVEMEALSAISQALLTVYDMCKAVDENMRIEQIELIEKIKGREK